MPYASIIHYRVFRVSCDHDTSLSRGDLKMSKKREVRQLLEEWTAGEEVGTAPKAIVEQTLKRLCAS